MQILFSMPIFKTDASGKRYLPAVFGADGKSAEFTPTERFTGTDADLIDQYRALYNGMVAAALNPADDAGAWLRDKLANGA